MEALDIRNKTTRIKITKFTIVMAIAALIGSLLWILNVLPEYNGTVFVVTLIITSICLISGLILFLHPEHDWDHDGASS